LGVTGKATGSGTRDKSLPPFSFEAPNDNDDDEDNEGGNVTGNGDVVRDGTEDNTVTTAATTATAAADDDDDDDGDAFDALDALDTNGAVAAGASVIPAATVRTPE
jgi:hypothetical protein